MKPGGGKRKGASFERKVCERLSLWISNGANKDLFWRSSLSGGRATVRKGEVRQCGDICAVHPDGHVLTDKWFIECKHMRALGMLQFVLQDIGPMNKFWEKAWQQARDHKREPMMIVKENRGPIFMITRIGALEAYVEPLVRATDRNHGFDIYDFKFVTGEPF